ncbi:MAG: signal peptidase I [Acidobacteriota bacterium]|nr:signal peptidase I [Acidobacteriota bacterium]
MTDVNPSAPDVLVAPEPEPATPGPTRNQRRRRIAIEWAVIVVLAVLVSFLMRTYVVQTFFIPSASMEPTLQVGDRILVSKLSVDLGTIHRGDIVVFKAPPAEHCGDSVTDLVKRVIGLPGDHLTSRGNKIYYNGHLLHETWTHIEPLQTPIGNVTVPANSYYVMGDNHPDSCDSRYWGSVPRKDLIGKVFLRIWPLSRIGFL